MTSTEPRWLTDQEQSAWRGFLRMQNELPARLNRALQESADLSLPDFQVLVHLSEAEGERLRAFALARSLQWEKSRLSHQLTRMERRGLVERQTCPSDARGAFVALTPEGRAVVEKAAPGHVEEVRRLFFDRLTPAQVKALSGIGAAVAAGLDEEPTEDCTG